MSSGGLAMSRYDRMSTTKLGNIIVPRLPRNIYYVSKYFSRDEESRVNGTVTCYKFRYTSSRLKETAYIYLNIYQANSKYYLLDMKVEGARRTKYLFKTRDTFSPYYRWKFNTEFDLDKIVDIMKRLLANHYILEYNKMPDYIFRYISSRNPR